jgi:putative ABC transport system permease protein
MFTPMHSQNSKNTESPPKLPLRFFRWYCHPDYQEDIEGDLLERFERRVEEDSVKKARWELWKDILRLFRPGIIKPIKGNDPQNYYSMYKNYFKIAFRVFKKEKFYTLINLSGLVLGFTCCLMIYLFIKDELSYDQFHKDKERIYRVASAYMREGRWEPYSSNSYRTGELLGTNFGEIEQLVKIRPQEEMVEYGDKRIVESGIATVDENFFEVFSFPLVAGDPSKALKGTNKVVISESLARKYFGDEDPMGKVFEVDDGAFQVAVSGVMQDMPSNSHFHFDFLISGETAKQFANPNMFTNVGWDSQHLYIKVEEGTHPQQMEARFTDFIDNNLAPLTSGNFKLFLQPLTDIHLKSHNGLEIEDNGNITHIYIFSVIAIFILFIACVNYMNLTTARSLRRAKEVGMRKVSGANRWHLITQFLSESYLMICATIVISLALTFLLLPQFNAFAGKEISRNILWSPEIILMLLGAFVIVGVISGAYPSFVLSAFKPLKIIKGNFGSENSSLGLRKGLVVLQFVVSIGLIAATGIVFKQLEYLKNKDLGINKDLVVAVPLETIYRSQLDVFSNELTSNPSIKKVGYSNMKMPGWISNSTYYQAQDVPVDEEARKSMKIIRVDYIFLNVIESEMLEGRGFSKDFPSDPTSSIILNEAAVEQLGWEEPIGRWMELNGERFTTIGVVKNFHFESLHRKIPPTIFILSSDWLNWAYVKIDGQNIPATLEKIEDIYSKFVTNRDFSYSFMDKDVERQYVAEEKFTQIFEIFTMLAIVIASLGTFGLISFNTERRSKEIAIRKVLGASVSNVTLLLIREFIILLLIASIIAWPLTYYFLDNWIETFVYRTSIGMGAFIIATVLAILITVGTTGFRAMKAAVANPIDSLKNE